MSETNRRKHARVKPRQLVTRVRAGEDLHIGLGIENISMGGVFVRINTPLKIGRLVTLELLRPGASQPLAITGRVTSSVNLAQAAELARSAGMGIAFDSLPPHLQQRLEGLVAAIDPEAVRPSTQIPVLLPVAAVPPTVPRATRGAPAVAGVAPRPSAPSRAGTAKIKAHAPDRTELVTAFVPRSNEQLQRQIEALKVELKDRNQKIEELLGENKELWQRVRVAESGE